MLDVLAAAAHRHGELVMAGFLYYLGRRRPTSLATQADYAEVDVKNRASSPTPKPAPRGVHGERLGGKPGRTARG